MVKVVVLEEYVYLHFRNFLKFIPMDVLLEWLNVLLEHFDFSSLLMLRVKFWRGYVPPLKQPPKSTLDITKDLDNIGEV